MTARSHDGRAGERSKRTGVDAHHHVWRLARGDYGWLTPALAPIHRDFDLDDYRRDLGAIVGATVLVQAAPTIAETEFLLDVAHRSAGLVQGVVGWVPLDAAGAGDAIRRLAGNPLLKSIRPMLQDLADADWILRPNIVEALRTLPETGLRFDALVRPRELPALLKLVEREPELAVVVDHGGKPNIAAREWQPWAPSMKALAGHPGVHCKLSGLATEAGPDWTVDALRPYADHLLDCFGPRRLLWGSDWPVVNLAGGCARWREASAALLAPLPESDRDRVWGENAREFYGLRFA